MRRLWAWHIAIVAAMAFFPAAPGCRKDSPCPSSTDDKDHNSNPEAHPAGASPPGADGSQQPSSIAASVAAARDALAEHLFDPSVWKQTRSAITEAAAETARQLSDDEDTYIAAGLRAFRRGENALAAERFYKAFEIDPTRLDALHCMCEALVADQSYDQAVDIYEMIVEMDREDHVSRFNLGVIYSRLRRFGEAEAVYTALLGERGDYVRARYNLAVLYQAQGKLADAAETWQMVIRCNHELPSAHASLGQVYLDLGEAEAAMVHYGEAAKLRPKEVGGWVNLAAASQAAGSLGRAHVAMQRAVHLAPEDADLWRELGNLQLDLHRSTGRRELLDQACASWQRSLALDGDQGELQDWLATYRPAGPTTRPAR